MGVGVLNGVRGCVSVGIGQSVRVTSQRSPEGRLLPDADRSRAGSPASPDQERHRTPPEGLVSATRPDNPASSQRSPPSVNTQHSSVRTCRQLCEVCLAGFSTIWVAIIPCAASHVWGFLVHPGGQKSPLTRHSRSATRHRRTAVRALAEPATARNGCRGDREWSDIGSALWQGTAFSDAEPGFIGTYL